MRSSRPASTVVFLGLFAWSGAAFQAPAQSAGSAPVVGVYPRLLATAESQSNIEPILSRLLVTELSCTACHSAEDRDDLSPKRGPNLSHINSRLRQIWVRQYLIAPHATAPGTTMPDVLSRVSPEQKPTVVRSLLAFLDSQSQTIEEPKATGGNPVLYQYWRRGNSENGHELFHHVGCVACHDEDAVNSTSGGDAATESDTQDVLDIPSATSVHQAIPSTPLHQLQQKYTQRGLVSFLHQPLSVRPSGRMPSFGLSTMEASDVAQYLFDRGDGEPVESDGSERKSSAWSTDARLISTGRQWFASLGCANCHEVSVRVDGVSAPTWDQVVQGLSTSRAPIRRATCVSKTWGESFSGARYHLSARQRSDIQNADAFGTELSGSLRTTLHLAQRNCYACHERDAIGGLTVDRRKHFETVRPVDLGDEGRLPPPLTLVGAKLQSAWMKKVLSGAGRVRTHMHARMPGFDSVTVGALPSLLHKQDEAAFRTLTASEDTSDQTPNTPKKDVGRSLVNAACIQCHPINGNQLPGTIGIDLAGVEKRIRADWFRAFIRNPELLKARTRMPTLFPQGKSMYPKILAGNTAAQIESIWQYVLEPEPLPENILKARSDNYELRPTNKPILLRTFMEVAGTHAIAVGFPSNVHIAYDAERAALAQAWRGRFLDARGTWFERFTPPAKPLGVDVIDLRNVVELVNESAPHDRQFKGFRLDAAGVPTLLSQMGGFNVRDRMMPDDHGNLMRTLQVQRTGYGSSDSDQDSSTMRVLIADKLVATAPQDFRRADGLEVSIRGTSLQSSLDGEEAIIRLKPAGAPDWTSVEIIYRWSQP